MRLTINSVEKKIQILFSDENQILAFAEQEPEYGATEILIPMIRDLMAKELTTQNPQNSQNLQNPIKGNPSNTQTLVHSIACVTGPGNFMGIRMALSTSAGLARAFDAEQAPLNYMQCLANSISVPDASCISVLTNATRTHVHRADFIMKKSVSTPSGQSLKTLMPLGDTFLMPLDHHSQHSQHSQHNHLAHHNRLDHETIPPLIPADNYADEHENRADHRNHANHEIQYILGSALLKYPDQVESIFPNAQVLDTLHPSAEGLFIATQNAIWQKEDLSPMYLKECDALQNFSYISQKQGRDPKKARVFLDELLNS